MHQAGSAINCYIHIYRPRPDDMRHGRLLRIYNHGIITPQEQNDLYYLANELCWGAK